MRKFLFWLLLLFVFTQCKKGRIDPQVSSSLYFPPMGTSSWQTVSPALLGWNETELANLFSFLEQKGTKAFIILKNGHMAVEQYFGNFTADSTLYWASAGKTMTAFLVGIARQEGKLNINHKTSRYLGTGWTSLPLAKENLITIRHQLTMTTGLDDKVPESDCTQPACLQYKEDAGSRWSYHNAPYTLLEKVVESATNETYNYYFQQKIRDRIGMDGVWIKTGFNNVYFSMPRSMARFGLLLLNDGKWNETSVLTDMDYYNNQMNASQNFNPSYGYLTWLNRKASYMLPQTQFTFNGPLIPNAPQDAFAALGKNDQKIYVVPSQNLVIIRMGESAGNVQMVASSFDNELWGKLRGILKL
jgi:CubicO group peptidase (beta-lactamase class C family)